MATTYVPLATTTTSGNIATITLSSISGAYTDLILVGDGRNSAGGSGWSIRFNGDTGNNYSWTDLEGDGSTAASYRQANTNLIYTSYNNTSIGNSQSNYILQINNYSNTTTYKTVLSRTNAASSNVYPGTNAGVGMWRNTNAITSITITSSGGYMVDGTTFSLYGIASAGVSAKATGGNIISTDGVYYYHTFTSSGTFTPSQALTCDYLVIAGGASGWLGGGGAGGLRSTVSATGGGGSVESPLSLLSGTNYTVTIGAGGAPQGIAGNNSVFSTITSTGGGAGSSGGNVGGTGGSGGGGGYGLAGGSGTTGQGFAGGTGSTSGGNATGGGGGAGAVGTNSASGIGGNGGNGASNSIIGTSVTYAGGGGAYGSVGAGTGGTGGGGNGSAGGTGGSGTVNTGSGGAGGGSVGGAGGSGLVIVRYAV